MSGRCYYKVQSQSSSFDIVSSYSKTPPPSLLRIDCNDITGDFLLLDLQVTPFLRITRPLSHHFPHIISALEGQRNVRWEGVWM